MIEVKKIEKYFGTNHVLKNVSFLFERGKTNLIIGESGSGKTTLIKILIGLHKIDSGTVMFDGIDFNSIKIKNQRKLRQEIGMLFQGGALYDYMSVEEILCFRLTCLQKKQR
jgi:phospholipid/cholesterol/gamma-HCH transport system ATP-binding protein